MPGHVISTRFADFANQNTGCSVLIKFQCCILSGNPNSNFTSHATVGTAELLCTSASSSVKWGDEQCLLHSIAMKLKWLRHVQYSGQCLAYAKCQINITFCYYLIVPCFYPNTGPGADCQEFLRLQQYFSFFYSQILRSYVHFLYESTGFTEQEWPQSKTASLILAGCPSSSYSWPQDELLTKSMTNSLHPTSLAEISQPQRKSHRYEW